MMKNYSYLLSATLLLATGTMTAQTLDFKQYMTAVETKNTGLLVEKFNIDIATAQLQAARVFNDPSLSFTYSNNQDKKLQMGQSYELGLDYNFSLGGVRHARIGMARSQQELSEAAVEDYLRNLRAEAAVAWAEAWRAQAVERLMASSYEAMNRIARSDSLRLHVGEINETDAAQSRLEAQSLYNEWLQSQVEKENARMELARFMGGTPVSAIEDPLPDTSAPDKPLAELLAAAEDRRADLKVAELTHQLSENNLRLVQATRAMELGLNAGYACNTKVRNEIAPAPSYHGVSVGISIPLKFSSFNRGEKMAAQASVKQSEMACEAARQQIRTEVTQAYNASLTAEQVLKHYRESMLANADAVLKNRTFGYLHGESGLLDLLTAQRTYNDIYRNYLDVQCNRFICNEELQRAVGN